MPLRLLRAPNRIVGVDVVHKVNPIFQRTFPGIYRLPQVGINPVNLEEHYTVPFEIQSARSGRTVRHSHIVILNS